MTAVATRVDIVQTTIDRAEPRVDRDHRTTAALLALLVVVGGVLRFWGLGATRLSYDESFTAMAGRLPIGSLFSYLRIHDSHPPLDYLLRAPIARAGLSEFWVRTPSVVCSIGALALFAWWMRSRGAAGVFATAMMAVSTFEIEHGRAARMYAELELLGVGIAVLTATWLTRPRRWHAPALGVLVFLGLLTHVSMFLLAAGLIVVPGRRTDREAWRWRAAIVLAVLGWALVWGSIFLTQTRGGHSAWIPLTTIPGLETAIGRLLTYKPALATAATLAVIAGGVVIGHRDRVLGRVWVCAFAIPIGLAAIAGLFEPVVLDRTFTLMAWAPFLALAYLLDVLARRQRVLGVVALVGALALMVPSTLDLLRSPVGPNTPLRELARVAKPGDIIATRPQVKALELQWTFGVRGDSSSSRVAVPGIPKAFGMRVGTGTPTGRVWLLDWRGFPHSAFPASELCAPPWKWHTIHITCLRT